MPSATLFALSLRAMGISQREMAAHLRVSRRTTQRWISGGSMPVFHAPQLAALVHRYDEDLAARLAATAGTTLVALGLGPAAPEPPPGPPDCIVDAVVCAAADALGLVPRDVRASVHAAFARAAELGLTIDKVERVLRPAPTARAPSA